MTMERNIKLKSVESIPCEVCGMSNERELSTRDRDDKYFRTVICKKCGLVYTNPRPLSSEIEEYYKGSYYLDYKGIYQPKKKHIFRAARIAMKRIQQIQKYIFPNMKALDIGSGSGEMVYAMRLAGIDCSGLEPNEGYATYARDVLGLPVSIGHIETTAFPRNSCDVVLMYHSIEHLHSPAKGLLNIHSCLRPEGILVVECPNVEAHCQTPSNRLHGAHLYNFNEVTLRALGEKAGFQTMNMSLSSDGGNILAIFRKKKDITPVFEPSQNYHRVMKAWTNHTTLKYFLSLCPYRRMLSKVMRFSNETQKTVFAKDGLTLLQNTFAKSLTAVHYNRQKG